MGNSDDFIKAIVSRDCNKLIPINKKAYFSFAFSDEIALVINGRYYILNCTNELWKKVDKKIISTKNLSVIKKWWFKQSKNYIISSWSSDFNDIEKG